MIKSRKGQITIFIIIGIILLIVVAIFISLRASTTKQAGEAAIKDTLRQKNEVYQFTEECLRQTGLRALKRLGELGGYTSLEGEGLDFNEFNAIESDGIQISRDVKVPYWLYLKTNTLCYNCK